MNKLRYRIVFNKARGMCMAVQETARSRTKGAGQGVADSSVPAAMRLPALRRMPFLLTIGLGGMILSGSALAQIVADPKAPGQQQATVLNAANGVLQVNIQTPSAAGVSRNVYSQFDVPKTGAVLNNSRSNVQTQLGGWVQGNPWLSKGTARVILNEVNSSDPSRLQGYIEVAGDRAETIIANPAGIVVDGGGFINVSRATLTTGSPIIEHGSLKGYSVQRGQIVIDGAGLDASKTDYTALIARALQVNAGLWAQRLSIITGANQVEEATQAKVTQTIQAADAPPLFAVDVARLGGMYANQIYLVGTEAGVGVRNAGVIGAVAGDLVVTANGRLENSGTLQASQSLQASARDVDNQSVMQARDTLAVTAGDLTNTGQISAGVEASIKVQGDVNNESGKIEAARIDIAGATLHNAHGSIVQTGASALAIEASQLTNITGALGRQNASADAGTGGTTTSDGSASSPPNAGDSSGNTSSAGDQPGGGVPVVTGPATVLADGRLTFRTIDNTAGSINANGATVVRAESLDNRGGQAYLDSLSVAGSSFDNSGGTLAVLRSFTARTESFVNDQGKLLVGAMFDGGAGSFSNRQGLLQAGQLSVDVKRYLDNSGGTLRQLGGATASISVGGELALDRGTLEAAAGLHLKAGSISGIGSTLNVIGDLALESGTTIAAKGTWLIEGGATFRTGALDNGDGKIVVGGALYVDSAGLNNTGGTIAAATDAAINAAGGVENSHGIIQAGRDLKLAASGTLDNHAGDIETLSSSSAMRVVGATIDNREGRIANAGTGKATLEAATVTNSGVIGGNGDVEIAARMLTNEVTGSIVSFDNMEMSVRGALLNAGRINAGGTFRLTENNAQLSNYGTLVALGDITIAAAAIDNTAGQIATTANGGGKISLQAASLVNRDGLIDADGHALIDIQGNVDNERGHIRVGGDLALHASERIENRAGTIETAGRMQVHGGEIGNEAGKIVAAGTQASSIEADRNIDNNGLIGANGQFTVKAETFSNGVQGTLTAASNLDLAVRGRLGNDGGTISTAGALNFDEARATLVNSGSITAAGSARLNIDQLNNDGGTISTLSGASLGVTANGLSNRGGRVMAGAGASMLIKEDVDNEAGVLQAAGSFDTGAGGSLRNRGGVIEALDPHGTLAVRAADIDNTGGRIVNVGDGAAGVSAAAHIENSGLIGANGQLEVAAATMNNTGTVSSASKIELAVGSALSNSGTISAASGLHADQADATLRNTGTIVAGGPIGMTFKTVDNTGGQIATAQGSNADMLLSAQNASNRGGAIMSDRHATFQVSDGFDNRSGLVQAKGQLQLGAGGLLDTSGGSIETVSADSTLQLHAGAVLNDAGRIVNVGGGDMQVRADTTVVNNGQIAGNGVLRLGAQSLVNQASGSISGAALELQVGASMENTGDISSGSTLVVDGSAAALSNHGNIVANGDIAMRADAIDNAGGTVATVLGSGASVSLEGTSLSNHGGRIVADRALTLGMSGALDNDHGIVHGSTGVQVTVGGNVSNDGGVIEATDAGAALALQANSIHNGSGRIVNVGQGGTTVAAADRLENSGLVAGNGRVDLRAGSLVNLAPGTLASVGAMAATIGTCMDNAGVVNSGATLDIAAQAAEVHNNGLVVASGALTLTSATFDNDGGQLATAKGSGADVQVNAANVSNRGGTILADRDVGVTSADAFDNTKGILQAAGSLRLNAAGTAGNDGGVIEAIDPSATLSLHAGTLDNGSGRVVNVGTGATAVTVDGRLSSAGMIAGNGSVELAAADLDNLAGANIAAGTTLGIAATRTVGNAGTLSSQETLRIDAVGAAVRNSGTVVSGASATLDTGRFDNSGGLLATSTDRGGDVVLHASEIANVSGTIVADGAVQIMSGAGFDNRRGAVRANNALGIDVVGALGNQEGAIEVAGTGAPLDVRAQSIDNSAGRLVNVGNGATHVAVTAGIVNSGILAGNGNVDLNGATVDNLADGTIAAGSNLDLHVSQALDNAGTVSAARALNVDQPAAKIANSGRIVAADRIALHGTAISNDGGQIGTQSGAIALQSESTLSNRNGVIAAAGDATLSALGAYDNSQGQVQTPGRLQITTGGSLSNIGGALEAVGSASTFALQAASIDNTAGRIVNAGSGATSIDSAAGVVNSGAIIGNGTLTLSARTLENVSGGTVGSVAALELAVRERLANAGTISSSANLHFDQASASFSNTGHIGAGGPIAITAATLGNRGGQLYTASGSGAAISLRTGSLDNTSGIVSADGQLLAEISGSASNGGGALHGGAGTTLSVGSQLANGSGTIEAAAGMLDVRAQSIGSSGRIVNAGMGRTIVESATGIVNSGTIAGNWTLDLHASVLQNLAGGQIASGGALQLDVRQLLANAGRISSSGTLVFDQAGASFSNRGEVAAAGNIGLTAASFDNNGGQVSTVHGSNADITVVTSAFGNRDGAILADGNASFLLSGDVDNTRGTLQAGSDLILTTTGNVTNGGGVIETLGAASSLTLRGASIDNGNGRIGNTGTGETRLLSQTNITNAGTIAAMGNLLLSGQTLSNQAGATIASGRNLALEITRQAVNNGKINSGGMLTFDQSGVTFTNSGEVYSGGNAIVNVSLLNNDGGRLGTGGGSGADLTLTTPQLSNHGGRIATDRDLVVNTHVVNTLGELFAGRDLSLTMDGDYAQGDGVQQLGSNRNLSLSVTGNITNSAALEAGGVLTLSGQQINNQSGASIAANGVILKANGNLTNAGEINGASGVDITAANVSNSGGIVGGNVTVATANLDNSGSSALIGATGALGLGVAGTLNNTSGATLYSSGDMVIAGRGGGSAGAVNNISSTIEAAGSLALSANSLSNVRENVQIVKVKTVDESVQMSMPGWYQYGDNHDSFEASAANYRPHEVYFVNPSDILDDQVYVTPDGYTIHRAVIRTHANDSAFYVAASGLSSSYGQQARLTLSEGTRVIYYTEADQVANPDQGAPASNVLVYSDAAVTHWSGTVSFSNQYGNCSNDCIRLVTQPDYVDPRSTILRDTMRALAPVKEQLEVSRDAHHTVVEDQLVPGAGASAQILAGGNMYLNVSSTLDNRYGDIKARGSLLIDERAAISNIGATLYRTHTFDGTWQTYGGQSVSYQQPTMSEAIGAAAGVIKGGQGVSISGRSFNNIDVTAGTVGNIRDAVNVIGSGSSGAGTAGSHVTASAGAGGTTGGQVTGSVVGPHAGLADAIAATDISGGPGSGPGAIASGTTNQLHAGGQAGDSGYANDAALVSGASTSGTNNSLAANGAVGWSGATNSGRLGEALSAARNNSSLGNIMIGTDRSTTQQASSVQGTGFGDVTKVSPGGLFIRNPDASGSYLFETRPQFADQQQWTSSDYLLKQLSLDPATTQKRLGDGFYEQRLVREQMAELTGHASNGGASDDSTYLQLLTNAVSVAREVGLRPGVALSAEQVSHLTSDIVWLESQNVMLPDGSVESVLVPKVYLAHVGKHALQPGGALVTGNGVTIDTTESIVNSGGVIDGGNGRTLLVAGQDIVNRGGAITGAAVALVADRDVKNESLAVTEKYDFGQNGGSYTSLSNLGAITATGTLDIMAGRDLSDLAGRITAGSATLTAGRNIDFGTIRTGSTYQSQIGGYTEKDSSIVHQLSQISTGGDLKIAATGNLNLSGTQVAIGTGGSGTGQLLAGGTINIAAVTNEVNTSVQNDPSSKQYDKQVHQTQALVGTAVAASSGLTVGAGILEKGAINITASSITAGDALKLTASDSVNIVSAQEQHLSDTALTRTSSSFLKSKTTQQTDYVASSQAIGSTLSGKTVDISAGKDINVLGSAIAGDGDVSLAAVGSVNIGASTSTLTEQHHMQVKESGFLSGNGFGFSIGTRTTTTDQSRDATTQSGQSRSMVGSLGGNLSIVAGNAIKVSGSDLAAGMNMSLDGRSVTIDPGLDKSKGKFEQTSVQDGLSFSVGGSVVNAISTVQGMTSAASQSKDGRVQALAAATAGLAVKDAAGDVAKNGLNLSVSLTVGHSESKYTQTTSDVLNSGSVLKAGNDITILASGGGKDSNINVIGSDLDAKGNITLKADNQVNLLAAQDQESQHSESKTMSAAAGIGASIGTKGTSVGFTANVSASRGNTDGDGTTQLNTHVAAGNQLTIASGGDTNLKGAVASGNQVIADVGGNLNIESLQDKATFDSQNQGVSVGATVGVGVNVGGSINQSKMHNDYASVQEQSGIRAGDGGFQVNVGGNTDLKGGVISSSGTGAEVSSLVTGTLTHSDIANHATASASSAGMGGGFTVAGNAGNVGDVSAKGDGGIKLMNLGGSGAGVSLPSATALSSNATGITRSGIGAGSLVITDDAVQRDLTGQSAVQAAAGVNRNVVTGSDTGGRVANNFDPNATSAALAISSEFTNRFTSTAAPLAANLVGDIAKAKEKTALDQAYDYKRSAEAAAARGDSETAKALNIKADEAKAVAEAWGENGVSRVALHAGAQGLIGGVASGNAGALSSISGAVGGNLGQQLGKDLGEAEADRRGLQGQEREDLINSYQQTLATVGGAIAGWVASSVKEGGKSETLASAVQAANTASVIDVFNRQLHPGDLRAAKTLAAKSDGKYTEKEIQEALRYAGLRNGSGTVLVAEGTAEVFVNSVDIRTGATLQDTLKADPTMPLGFGDKVTLSETAPTRPNNELINFIVANTGGAKSPYVMTLAPTYSGPVMLPSAPAGTTRATMVVEGAVYYPLVAPCPAVSCTNGDPIAFGIQDAGTSAYLEALSRRDEKYLNIGTGVLGVGGTVLRGISTLAEVASNSARVAAVPEAVTIYGTTFADETAALRRMSTTNTSDVGTIFNARISLKPYVVDGDVNGLIQQLNVSSEGRPLGFWSGNLGAAMKEASNSGAALLETTPGGSIANNWTFLNKKFTWNNGGEQFWGGLSSKYASGASGDIFVWQTPDKAINASGVLDWKGGYIWQNYERPIIENLQSMGGVGDIQPKLVAPTPGNSPSRWH
jgi:filamentous hemagglutinin